MNAYWLVLLAATIDAPDESIVHLRGKVLTGSHRMLSSSKGFNSYNSRSARILFRIDKIEDDKLSGMLSSIGIHWNGRPEHLVDGMENVTSFSGEFKGDKVCITLLYDNKSREVRRFHRTTRIYGRFEGGRIAGYFTDEWLFSDGEVSTYGGTIEVGSRDESGQ